MKLALIEFRLRMICQIGIQDFLGRLRTGETFIFTTSWVYALS